MATAMAARQHLTCLPKSLRDAQEILASFSGSRQMDVTRGLPMGRRMASTAVPPALRSKTRESVSPSWLPGGKHECSGFSHRREANGEASLLGNCDTPRKLADLDRLDDLKICDIDDGEVVRDDIIGRKIFFVCGQR